MYSTRKRKPVKHYVDEAYLTAEYKKILKQHEKIYATIKENDVEKNLLVDVIKDLYVRLNNDGVATKPCVYKEWYLGKIRWITKSK